MKRRYDIDWMRDITVLSIIFYHSLIIFFTRESAVMFVRSGVDLPFCIYTEAIMSRICMPLLFLLAGYSAKYSLEKRTVKEFILNRVKKLLLPFLIVSFTLNPVVSYIYGITQGRDITFSQHMFKFVTSISENFEGRTTGYSPMHLWFLLFLFVFSLVCAPAFAKCNHPIRQEKMAGFFQKPGMLLLFVIPYPFVFLIEIMDEMNPLAYLYLFLVGYVFATSEKYQQALDRDKWLYTVLAVVTIGVSLYSWFWYQGSGSYLLAYCVKAARILSPFAIIGLGHSYIKSKNSRLLNYLNQANFFIYLIHMLVLTAVGYVVLQISVNPIIQFIVINLASYGICFGIFEIYRRGRQKYKK